MAYKIYLHIVTKLVKVADRLLQAVKLSSSIVLTPIHADTNQKNRSMLHPHCMHTNTYYECDETSSMQKYTIKQEL